MIYAFSYAIIRFNVEVGDGQVLTATALENGSMHVLSSMLKKITQFPLLSERRMCCIFFYINVYT